MYISCIVYFKLSVLQVFLLTITTFQRYIFNCFRSFCKTLKAIKHISIKMYGLHYYYVMIDFKDYIMSYKMVCK